MTDLTVRSFVVLLDNTPLALSARAVGAPEKRPQNRRSRPRIGAWNQLTYRILDGAEVGHSLEDKAASDEDLISRLTIAEAIAAFTVRQGGQ